MNAFPRVPYGVFLLVVILAACVPTTPPAQLAHTPEPPIIISDGVVDNGAFTVRYPAGWEVVTGMDGVMVFSSPDGQFWAMVSSEALVSQPTPQPDATITPWTERLTTENGETIDVFMLFHAPKADFAAAQAIMDAISLSITLSPTKQPA